MPAIQPMTKEQVQDLYAYLMAAYDLIEQPLEVHSMIDAFQDLMEKINNPANEIPVSPGIDGLCYRKRDKTFRDLIQEKKDKYTC